jgi:hypothetical protein
MAGLFSKQIIKDSTTETVVKFVGYVDSVASPPQSDGANSVLAMSSLNGAYDINNQLRSATGNAALGYYGTNIRKITWSVGCSPANSAIQLYWKGGGSNANVVAFNFAAGSGVLDFTDGTTGGVVATPSVTILGSGANGGDLVVGGTAGLASASYTIVVALRKNPSQFDRGYLIDPSSFSNP